MNCFACLLAVCMTAVPSPAAEPSTGRAPIPTAHLDDRPGDDPHRLAEVLTLVESSHRFLAKHQNKDGSFSILRAQAGTPAPVAVTALTALSFMAGGHSPERGRYAGLLRDALEWLVDHCDQRGYFTTDNDQASKMHGQGYALLALTQAYGMFEDVRSNDRTRDAIERGVALVESTQGEIGGWWYEPARESTHEGSITVCMIQALRAAKDAGFAVDQGVIDRAVRYMERSQDPRTGRFRYAINDPKTSWALTAAALATLNALGDYGSETLDAGFEALKNGDPFTRAGQVELFRDYGALYAAQAYWAHRDARAFQRWWPDFVAASADRQDGDGSFSNGTYGSAYATAIVSLTLQVPLGYLPLFQR